MIKGDFHIHTVLSPCGDIEMTPAFIVRKALETGMDFIAITDHNSTRQYDQVKSVARGTGLSVLCGAEVTTKEEVHVLVFIEDNHQTLLQEYLDRHLSEIKNRPDFFGYQLVVDQDESVVYEEERLLINAIDQTIEELESFIHALGGIFIPAHIDKKVNSIISQLGFVSPGLKADAFDLSKHTTYDKFIEQSPYLKNKTFITSSDAHYPDDLGTVLTELDIDYASFESIRDYFYSLRSL